MPTKKASSTEQLKESAAASSKASKSTAAKKPKAAAKPKGTKTTAKRTAAKQQYKLVIVESPAKAKTIQKYLGKGYQVMASMGHVRDLPKSRLGVDIEHDFAPEYIDIRGKGQLRNELKKAAKHASFVYLATDPDREGEAISWHLSNMLDLGGEEKSRVTFNEITKTGIKSGMAAPRNIDINLVNDPTHPRPPGGLQAQSLFVENGQAGSVGRQGAVGGR